MRAKPYPRYKRIGIGAIDELPEHWAVKRGRFCMHVNPPSEQLRRLAPEEEVSFVPMDAVGEYGGLDLEALAPIRDIGGSYTEFQDGDVVVAKITPCFENGKGALAVGLKNGAALGTTELHVLRALPKLEPKYLFYLTMSSIYRKTGEAEMYGAGGQKRVPPEFNKNFAIPLPPVDEQYAITTFLDREIAAIDTLVGKKYELIERLKEKRGALISSTVTRGLPPDAAQAAGLRPYPKLRPSGIEWLGDIPKHWGVRRIATESTKITNGFVGPTRDILVDDGVRYLQSLHVKDNRIAFSKPYFVELEWSREHSKSILAKDDVLIVQTGDIGQVAVVPDEFAGSNCHALIIVSPRRDRLSGAFLSLFLNSSFGFDELKRIQTGALHPHLNCGLVRDVRFPFPPLREQRAIVDFLNSKTRDIDQMIHRIDEAIGHLQEYRTALITAAVTGKIDVRCLGRAVPTSGKTAGALEGRNRIPNTV